jgi:1-piperideine-2-carboxylate/1-pyrroline-2-carboxylate reductase [NAD(P)H]
MTRYPALRATPLSFDTLTGENAAAEVLNVDVVIAATTSTTPVIPVQLPTSTLAIGVGAFKPNMAEFPPALLHARNIVVDHVEGARHEAGDLIQAGIAWDTVRDLATVLEQGRQAASAMPVLKTVGHAAWDLAAARVAVHTLAQEDSQKG